MIEYRVLHSAPEMEHIVDLEIAVWGLNPRNAVPSALMHVIAHNGGLALGAYDDATPVGMLICLPARRGDEWFLWSHMTGVHPAYQRQGIGLELKKRQREWALANGYRVIRWTSDPLQRGNAFFNLRLLRDIACLYVDTYHVNFYGEMDDDINRGMPSDRVENTWVLDQAGYAPAATLTEQPVPLVTMEANGQPVVQPDVLGALSGPHYTIEIPHDLDALRRADRPAVLAWRLALREAMQAAFAAGLVVFDFTRAHHRCHYHLRKK